MKHLFSISVLSGIILYSAVLLLVMAGCKNKSVRAEHQEPISQPSESLTETVTAVAMQEVGVTEDNTKPFKGFWSHCQKAELDEENGQVYGRYEVTLAIDLYDKSVYNGSEWSNGGFFVANDRHEGSCEIISYKIDGNEADIRYQSLSGAIISAKLVYNPKNKSVTLIDGVVVDAADTPQSLIKDCQILWDKTELEFKSNLVSGNAFINLDGMLSKAKIRMALGRHADNAEVRGHYCYTKYNIPIRLEGSVETGVYTLNEYNNGNVTGTFTLTNDGEGRWKGSWSNGEKTLPVKLNEILL